MSAQAWNKWSQYDMTPQEIYRDYENSDDMSEDDLFSAFESNNVHPGDIEILCGNEMMCRYERWIYFNIK